MKILCVLRLKVIWQRSSDPGCGWCWYSWYELAVYCGVFRAGPTENMFICTDPQGHSLGECHFSFPNPILLLYLFIFFHYLDALFKNSVLYIEFFNKLYITEINWFISNFTWIQGVRRSSWMCFQSSLALSRTCRQIAGKCKNRKKKKLEEKKE